MVGAGSCRTGTAADGTRRAGELRHAAVRRARSRRPDERARYSQGADVGAHPSADGADVRPGSRLGVGDRFVAGLARCAGRSFDGCARCAVRPVLVCGRSQRMAPLGAFAFFFKDAEATEIYTLSLRDADTLI